MLFVTPNKKGTKQKKIAISSVRCLSWPSTKLTLLIKYYHSISKNSRGNTRKTLRVYYMGGKYYDFFNDRKH